MKSICGVIFAGLVFSSAAFSEENSVRLPSSSDASTSMSQEKLSEALKQKKFEEDQRINDLVIRADAGSMSRYSAKFTLGYSGPSLTDIGGGDIPNPSNSTGDFRSYISGVMGMKYRLTSNDGLYFSGGIKTFVASKSGDSQDITDPSITYDHTYTFSPAVQARTSVFANMVTNSVYRGLGETNGFGVSQTTKWTINQSRWIVGGRADFNTYVFNRGYDTKDRNITDYYLSVIPSIEYKFTSNLNFNTSYLKRIAHYRKESRATTFDASTNLWNGRVGLGWAITHDIYVNPFIAYYPEAMTWDNASIGVDTIVSIF